MENIKIRRMELPEIETALDWAAQEGWNPGLHDGNCFFSTDPNGFFIAEENGSVVGVISAVKYSSNFGFIGFYIVEQSYRGGMAGVALGKHAHSYLIDCNIGLDGVLERIENYKRIGFQYLYKNFRYEGVIDTNPVKEESIVEINKIPFIDILCYDRLCFPSDRADFLNCWLNMPDSKHFAKIENGKINGYGVIRKCRKGYKIGPLFADNVEIAERIFLKLCEATAPEPIYFDTPEANPLAVGLALKYGMKECFATARMYSRGSPKIDVQKIYGVTSFELG